MCLFDCIDVARVHVTGAQPYLQKEWFVPIIGLRWREVGGRQTAVWLPEKTQLQPKNLATAMAQCYGNQRHYILITPY